MLYNGDQSPKKHEETAELGLRCPRVSPTEPICRIGPLLVKGGRNLNGNRMAKERDMNWDMNGLPGNPPVNDDLSGQSFIAEDVLFPCLITKVQVT